MPYDIEKNKQNLQKAISFAKENPDHPDSLELRRRLESGMYNFELKAMGKKTFPVETPKVDMTKVLGRQAEGQQSIMPTPSRAGAQVTGAAKDVGSDFLEMGKNIRESFQNRTERLGGDIERRQEDGTNLREKIGTGLGITATTLGTAVDAIEQGGMFIGKAFLTDEQEKAIADSISSGVGAVLARTEGSAGAETVKKLVAGYNKWAEDNPEAAANVRDVGSVVFSLAEVLGAKAGTKVVEETIDAATNVVKKTTPIVKEGVETTAKVGQETLEAGARKVDELFVPSQNKLEAKVNDLYQRAVKPTIQGKKNIGDVEKSKAQQLSAIRTINENSPTLKYTDEIGQVVEGRAPQSLNEFAQSVQQTKESIYKQYNDLSKQTGEAGVKVNPSEFVDELDTVINDRAVQIAAPETVKYAQDMKERFGDITDLSPEEVEDLIKLYNQDLNTFYRNPSADQGRKVAVDALIVNNLRKQLDETIENTTGEAYQALKTKYGALRSIEKDVLNATLRDARRNVNGLIDYTDIFTGGELAAGILTLNPAMMAKAGVQRGIKSYFKFKNDPNNQIKKMFEIDSVLKSQAENPKKGPLETAVTEGQPGMSIRSTVTPASVGSKLTESEFDVITQNIDDVALGRTADPDFNELLKKYGLSNADNAELERFLKEATDEFERPGATVVNTR